MESLGLTSSGAGGLMAILECKDLTKTYGSGTGSVNALRGINLSVERGEFVAVVGTSGSGKSTLLHLMGTVDRPTSGTVLIDGTDVSHLDQSAAALFRRRNIGIVYQFYNLVPTLSVRENILLPISLDRRSPDEAFLELLLKNLGLLERANALPHELSGGQQQRVAIARALIYRPAVLLADEPTGNLDRTNSRDVIDLIRQSSRELGQTVVLVTHDDEVALCADRVVTIEDGVIVADEGRR